MNNTRLQGISFFIIAFTTLLFVNMSYADDKAPTTAESRPLLPIFKLIGVAGEYSDLEQIMDSKGTIHTVFLGRHGDEFCMLDLQVPYKLSNEVSVLRLDACRASAVNDIALATNEHGDLSVAWIQEDAEGRSLILQKHSLLSNWMPPVTIPLQSAADNLAMALDAQGNLLAVWRVMADGGFYAAYCDGGGICQGVPGLRVTDTAEVTYADVVAVGEGDYMLLWEQNDDKGNYTIYSAYFSANHGFNTDPVVLAEGRGNLRGTWMAHASTPERIVVSWAARNIYAREFVRESGWKETHKVKEMYNSPLYVNLGAMGKDVIITWKDASDESLREITSKQTGSWDREIYFGDILEANELMWPKILSEQQKSLSLVWVEDGKEIWGNDYVSGSGWSGVKRINQEEYYSIFWYKALGNGQKSALIIFPSLDEMSERDILEFDSMSNTIKKYRTARDYGAVKFIVQYME